MSAASGFVLSYHILNGKATILYTYILKNYKAVVPLFSSVYNIDCLRRTKFYSNLYMEEKCMRKIYKTCIPLLSLSLLLLSGCADKSMQGIEDRVPGQETEDSLSPESGDVSAPVTFEARDLEGNTVSSQLFSETKLTMVNVWATYCNPCLREMPGLGELPLLRDRC